MSKKKTISTLSEIYYCKLTVLFKYKNVVAIEKVFYKPITIKNNNIEFMDYELIKLHKLIFTPKEKNKILKLTFDKIFFMGAAYQNETDSIRVKSDYEQFLNKLLKQKGG